MQNNARQCAQTVMSAISWSITLSVKTCWCFSSASLFQGPSPPQLGTHLLCQILANQVLGPLIPSAQNVDITRSEVPTLRWLHLLLTFLPKPASVLITLYSSDSRQCKIHLLIATAETFQYFSLSINIITFFFVLLFLFFFCLYEYSFRVWPLFTRNSQRGCRVWAFSPTQFISEQSFSRS